MKKMIFLIICGAALFAGCSEQQMRQADKVAADVKTITAGTEAILASPAGQMIPPDWRLYGLLGIMLANGVIIGWEEWRNLMLKKTTKAIVRGIESSSNPDKAASEVKDNIQMEMLQQGGRKFYIRANKIVDTLKIV